jgi:hypothetical protein
MNTSHEDKIDVINLVGHSSRSIILLMLLAISGFIAIYIGINFDARKTEFYHCAWL